MASRPVARTVKAKGGEAVAASLRFPRSRPAAVLAAAVLAALLATSCARDRRKPTFPVRGQVLYEGNPTPEALVIFHPLNDPDPRAMRPLGRVGADGRFTLTTYRAGDGAPAGDYAVTVSWQKEVDRQGLPVEERKNDEPNLLPDRYGKPGTSGLRVHVEAGANEFPPFRLGRP
jgi:hypothetical protein